MAKINIYDEFSPEDSAMLQALYSRSSKSVTEHVKKVRAAGSGRFMETFYIGYGHASIADCGSTTIFIEDVSILADKALQDWPLYSGQETSTRYIDMGQRAIIDPLNTPASRAILKKWMDFYNNSQAEVQRYLKEKYPKKEEEEESVYEKAIRARCFDITRSFLPAGITTQLSWHTNLRQAYDKLSWLRNHPLPEARQIADDILRQLKEKYPCSFSQAVVEEQENYRRDLAARYNFLEAKKVSGLSMSSSIKNEDLSDYLAVVKNRPLKTGLPNFLSELGMIKFEFNLDFGSFRDIQRHRHGVCRMPLLTTTLGFNDWYLEQLPEKLRAQALELIAEQKQAIDNLEGNPETKQYYITLGFNVFCRTTYGLPAAVYVVELRCGRAVHPTLRRIAHLMHQALKNTLPDLELHCDLEASDWDYQRGLQDISKK